MATYINDKMDMTDIFPADSSGEFSSRELVGLLGTDNPQMARLGKNLFALHHIDKLFPRLLCSESEVPGLTAALKSRAERWAKEATK